ncbi:MAG: FkbM family methyltransferase [Rhodopila sp.]
MIAETGNSGVALAVEKLPTGTAAIANRINVALRKPATQSSISVWSSGKTVEADASIANNGDTASASFFHTDHEVAPWWQVDLGDYFIIEQLRLFNRRDFAERLLRFTVLVSLSGEPDTWLPIYHKNDDTQFGRGNGIPFLVDLEGGYLARYVRIRKDDPGVLHLRECEVLGYPPQADQLPWLIKRTEQACQHLIDEQTARERELAAGRNGYVTRIGTCIVFVDTDSYSSELVQALSNGLYEHRERSTISALIQPTDRPLDIGCAVGVVTMTLAAIVGPANVMAYDANPAMVADARRNFAANRMDEIVANVGVMRNKSRWIDSESEVDFFIARNFWASRLAAAPSDSGIVSVVKVPLVCLESKIAEHRANVLVCDIEGGETDLLDGADIGPIRLIVLEVHEAVTGRQRLNDMIRFLVQAGFNIDLGYSVGGILVFYR